MTTSYYAEDRKRGIHLTVVVLIALMVAVLAGFINKMSQPRVISNAELRANGAVLLERPRILSGFDLVDNHGQPFNTESLKGQWTLVFFGFTNCPDVCPNTMSLLNTFYKALDEETMSDTRVMLVSVDPDRDSVQKLDEYVNYFHSDFIGVTGPFLNLKRFANQLNVPFNKVPMENGDYTMDHGGQVVLINPNGHYHAYFRAPLDPGRLKLTYRSMRVTFED